MNITEKELNILQGTDFLLAKSAVLKKIYNMLEETRTELKKIVRNTGLSFPEGTDTLTGKISRGENYKNLPYMVLDYPTLFTNDNTFAFRTMFWWGNFFSLTLHLEGEALKYYRNNLADNIERLVNQNIYIGIGKTPWEYHYEKHNYVPIKEIYREQILNFKFVKLSKRIAVIEWRKVPEFSAEFFKFLLSILRKQ